LLVVLGELRTQDKTMEKEIENVVKALKKQREIISTSSQINAAIDEVNNLAKMVVTMMPDEKLENVYKELGDINGSGEGSSNRTQQKIEREK